MSRSSSGTPGGIKFVLTVLVCAILVVIALTLLRWSWPELDGPQTNNSSSASVSGPDGTGDNDGTSGSGSDSSGGGEVKPDDPPGGGDHMNGKATLKRVGLTGKRLLNGTMVEFTDDSSVDFTNPTSENLFGIRAGETVVPGCRFTATMELCNEGDFALNYWLEVRMVSGFDTALAKQLKVTLTANGKEYSTTVGEPVGTERAPLGTLGKGEKVTFTISVEFIDSTENNAAQGQTVAFDMYATAIKAT